MRAGQLRAGYTLVELLVTIAIIGVLTSLVMVGVQRVRAAAARAACMNNLKQIGLALHNYHDAIGAFPAGCSYRNGADPQPHMAWSARLLPYIEQDALWRQAEAAYRQEKFFELGPHLPVLAQTIPLYGCPSDPRVREPADFRTFRAGLTSYLGVGGLDYSTRDGVLYLDSSVRLLDIRDGTASTVVVGERPPSPRLNFGWWYAGWGQSKDGSADSVLGVRERRVARDFTGCPSGPYGFGPGDMSNKCDTLHFWSLHTGGAHFLFADGSVRFLRYESDAIVLALATRVGGEVVSVSE